MQIRIGFAILAISLVFGILAGAPSTQSAPAARSLVLVNSYNYQDVISGAVYAAESGDDYLFILTPAQGQYLTGILASYHSPIAYFESDRPVVAGLNSSISSASGSAQLASTHEANLSDWFANHAPSQQAIVVGTSDGAEAVSVSSYAVLERAGLYFTDSAQAGALITRLKGQNKTILVYGSLASNLSTADLLGVQTIDTGSRYADNLEIVKRYMAASPSKQIVFASGQTFEKTFAFSGAPVALIGLTEASPSLLSYLKANDIRTGKIILGDGDTAGAQAMLTSDGVTLFPLIGEGYVGDAETRPLLVLPLPGPRPVLVIDGSSSPVRYDAAAKTFLIGAKNADTYPAFLRIVVQLPDGATSSSASIGLAPGESREISVLLDAGAYAADGRIDSATIFVDYGSSAQATEYIQELDYSQIPVSDTLPPQANQPPAGTGASYGIFMLLALLLLVFVFLFIKPKTADKAASPAKKTARSARNRTPSRSANRPSASKQAGRQSRAAKARKSGD